MLKFNPQILLQALAYTFNKEKLQLDADPRKCQTILGQPSHQKCDNLPTPIYYLSQKDIIVKKTFHRIIDF
jgi:hypothetical protein